MTIAESFKRFRVDHRLTQAQVAKALGVTQQAYQVYENKTVPTATVLMRIADAFNVSIDYLLGRTDSPHPYAPPRGDVMPRDEIDQSVIPEDCMRFYQALKIQLAMQGIRI